MDIYTKPLANYASLKIVRVLPSSDEDDVTPFLLRRLVSREYHINKEGVIIGSGQECGITLASEAGLEDKHIEIKWVPGNYL